MTIHSVSGPLTTHQYCLVQPNAIGQHGWLPVAWFGITSFPGRMWGCHVMLECGAIYRNVPLHHLATRETDILWSPANAQTWDCYGYNFSLIEYPFLQSRRVLARLRNKAEHMGRYIFTIAPVGDAWSAHPDQSKEFTVIALDNGRYTAQPTDRTLFQDLSFTTNIEWPQGLRRQTTIYSSEDIE